MQAIPVTLVQEVSSIVYKDLGVDNATITKWTSLIALPWTIKMLWGPLVDLNSTKRRWMLGMQALIAISLAVAAFAVVSPRDAFQISLGLLFITAIFSSTCDIATDGFYLLTLDKDRQAAFVGVQGTCYRLGRLFCIGALVSFAGLLQRGGMNLMLGWTVALGGGTLLYALGRIVAGYTAPLPALDVRREQPTSEIQTNVARTLAITGVAISGYFVISAIWRLALQGVWATFGGANPQGWMHGWMLSQDAVSAEWTQLAICLPTALALFFGAKKLLTGSEMGRSLGTFVTQKGILRILAFMVFYRFGEAMVTKMAPLFLKDLPSKGGMGLDNMQVGGINTAAVIGIMLGGIAGGVLVAKRGLRKSFWFIAVAMHLPNLLYLWAAASHPDPRAMYGVAFIEQFGYGFGFAGYMIYLMRIAQRSDFRTSHYAIASGLGAMCIMIAGISSGVVQSNFGYVGLFAIASLAAIPGLLTLLWIPIDE